MNGPKRLIYHYDRNKQPATREDVAGIFPVPSEGTLIIHNGKQWKVLRVEREEAEEAILAYRIFLSSSLG